MLGMPARVSTSVSGTMSCHLMLKIIRKHFAWKFSGVTAVHSPLLTLDRLPVLSA